MTEKTRARRLAGWLAIPLLASMLALSATPTAAFEIHEQILKRAHWPPHANGENVLALLAVRQTLRNFEEHDKIAVVIQYPGGDPGMQWGRELRGWLVSFGVPVRYIELQPGSGAADQLAVTVIDRR